VRESIGQIEIYVGRSWGNVEETLRNDGEASAQILALRTTEALRAHGLSIGRDGAGPAAARSQRDRPIAPTAATNAKPPANPPVETKPVASPPPQQPTLTGVEPSPTTRGLWLELAPATVISPGPLRTNLAGWLGARVELSPRWSCSFIAAIPFTSNRIDDPAGVATLSSYLLGLSIEATWLKAWRVAGSGGIGIAELLTQMSGSATPGYTGASETVVTTAPFAHLRLRAAVSPTLGVFAVGLLGTSIPEVRVKFDDRLVSSWGQPFLSLGAGIDIRTLSW
jgi:hypothetical protein